MRIHYLQHVPFEGPAYISLWSNRKGHRLTGSHLYNHEALPSSDQFDWLVIMGGPMNIYEEELYPWLKQEKEFIRRAVDEKKTVLGICLGAQLIADVLGGKVTKNPLGEIGWMPVTLRPEALRSPLFQDFPETFRVFQWHNDTFSTLGPHCICAASSDACANQAFLYDGRVAGLQFHLESTGESIRALLHHCGEEITEGPCIQSPGEIERGMHETEKANRLMEAFLNRLAESGKKTGY